MSGYRDGDEERFMDPVLRLAKYYPHLPTDAIPYTSWVLVGPEVTVECAVYFIYNTIDDTGYIRKE